MKIKFTSWKLSVIALLFSQAVIAQAAGDYQTTGAGTGAWSDLTSWERYNGTIWVTPAPSAPTSTDGVITILNTHTIVLTTAVTADQVVVASGGNLNVNQVGNNLTLNDGTGTDLLVSSGGTLLLRANNTIDGAGSMQVDGTMNWASGTLDAVTTISSGGILNIGIVGLDFGQTLAADLTNNGTVNWTPENFGFVFIGATFTNASTGTINEFFQVADRGFADGGGTNAFINNGTFNKTTTFRFFNVTVPFTNTGTYKGVGWYDIATGTMTNSGFIAPGASPGLLDISPAVIVGTTATIQIEIVSGTPGSGYDQLNVTGSANLDGVTLTVTDDPNSPVQDYIVMTSTGTLSGTPTIFKPTNFTTVGIVGGNTFVFHKDQQFPLPVVWGDFTALANNNKVKLNWSTQQEYNTSRFVVEYSNDGQQFSALTTIPAAGTSYVATDYTFTHSTPNLGKNNFYRIQEVDLDNKKVYSATRNVRFSNGNVVAVLATPNPVQNVLQLSVQVSNISIRLSDLSGRTLRNLNLQPGVHPLNVEDLPTGIYQLSIYQNKEQIGVQRIVKL